MTNGNRLHFRDNGYGIKPDILKKIFEDFYSTAGIGIGLSFCKNVMDKINGTIVCHSEFGKYTEFILIFPPPPTE